MGNYNWRVKGLLFENCSCQLLCPAHLSFKQKCTHERCIGHWAIHIDEGEFNGTRLDGLNMMVLFNSPQQMILEEWTEVFYIDERADDAQRNSLEMIFSGKAGGPWKVLARFVETRLETKYFPIKFEDRGKEKKMWIDGVIDTSIKAIQGKDKSLDAQLTNVFNQIHNPVQTLAMGQTTCTDKDFSFNNKDCHALYSSFSWQVTGK